MLGIVKTAIRVVSRQRFTVALSAKLPNSM